MIQLKNSIENTMMVIEETTTLFYQQKNQEAYQLLEPTLNTLMQTANAVMNYQTGSKEKLIDEQIFNVVLTEAMKAIEQKDTILLADILIYEVNELFEESLKKIYD